jgi:hypothetical protein
MRNRKLNRFAVALDICMAASGHSASSLLAAVQKEPHDNTVYAMQCWRRGKTRPRVNKHLDIVDKIEQFFELPEGRLTYLVGLRSTKQYRKAKHTYSQLLHIVRWHLPDDYDQRSEAERREILSWISRNVLPGSTDFGKYQSEYSKDKFSVVFPSLPRKWGGQTWMGDIWHKFRDNNLGCTVIAPPVLVREMRDILALKKALLPPKGYRRSGRWADTTAQTHVRRYGTIFGLLAADPGGPIRGLGVPVSNLTFGLFVFPDIWDWYLRWYEKKRGFFSSSDLTALYELKGFVRKRTGWIRQHPELGRKLRPVKGLVSAADIARVRSNWDKACDEVFEYAIDRVHEIAPLQRIHRDPFTPIMPVLTANSPLREYKKIGDELLRHMPNERKHPMHAATAVRGAIKGLLPHGPHAVRDVLATHLLKTTGSYELASFAIQDSLEAVMKHYARFLPHEKIARAAEEVNKVWRRGGSRRVAYRGDPAGMTQIVCRRRGRRNLVRDTSELVFL